MKIALVHDWLVVNAGAEKVLKEFIEIYPDAELFSLVNFLNPQDSEAIISSKKVQTSFIQKLPFAKKYFRNYLPLFSRAIESFNLAEYDLIISSSWAVAKGIKKSDKQIHICYCHTPVRYAWDLYDEYTKNLHGIKKLLVVWSLKRLREWDIKTLDRVDFFIANSKFVQERIARIYKREARVIYPPVASEKFLLQEEKEEYYLSASRLVPYKKTALIVEAFNTMPSKKLVVIGTGEEYDYIKKIAKSNISIMGYQKDAILIQKMQKAKAFVYGAIEDFGIVPIEAMATGTPVIALNDGGTAESVIDGVNGIHFEKQTKEAICLAVQRFEKTEFSSKTVRETALKYNSFKKEFTKFVEEKCENL